MNISRFCFTLLLFGGASTAWSQTESIPVLSHSDISYGADLFVNDSLMWEDRKIALVVNHTSILSNDQHLVDALFEKGADLAWIYAPEHGFRGEADAGSKIADDMDQKTGLPVRSLYGKSKKPAIQDLQKLDLIVFDIQDVGTRFYTYLSTMYYVMEVAAEAGTSVIILDRPNPNGFYVDGPVLNNEFQSFVGIIPIPIVHGMTLGELSQLIVGEGLIANANQLSLKVYPCEGYSHLSSFQLPIRPSPNLPNLRSILLYPSLCYFEASNCSIGRGTDKQFQVIGSPHLKGKYDYQFTPVSMSGAAHPKFEGQECYGLDLSELSVDSLLTNHQIQWSWLFNMKREFGKEEFIDRKQFLNLLMGTDAWESYLQLCNIEEWRSSYQEELSAFKATRKKYLLYPED